MDAWVAYALAVSAIVVVVRFPQSVNVYRSALVCAMVALVPLVQYQFGIISYSGQAWLSSAYLLGFVLAVVSGAHWEQASPGQAMDGLFLAIVLAGIVTVGVQLCQWLGLANEGLPLLLLNSAESRPFGNFNQPNQAATFLLWGVLASAWVTVRGYISRAVAVSLIMYLLFGVALTQSRMALAAVLLIVCVSTSWRRLDLPRDVKLVIICLGLYYLFCLWVITISSQFLHSASDISIVDRTKGEIRFQVYRLFLDSLWQHGLWGYGWAQSGKAQFAAALHHPGLGSIFMQSHNLFLDLMLWCGIPLGGLIASCLLYWLVDKARHVGNAQNALLAAFIGVIGWHAMLEFPLHYAYMLLPTGLVVGVLSTRIAEPVAVQLTRRQYGMVLMLSLALLTAIARDYLLVEQKFSNLRLEQASIPLKTMYEPESVLLLNQMDEFVWMGRSSAKSDMTDQDLERMRRASIAFPSLSSLFTLTRALAINNRQQEAQVMAEVFTRITSKVMYKKMRDVWRRLADEDPRLAAIVWPEMTFETGP